LNKKGLAVSDLLLIGGGHAHVQVIRSLAQKPLAGLRVTLVSADAATLYSGMLPGHVAGHYRRQDVLIDLASLCAGASVGFIRATVCGLEIDRKSVHLSTRPSLQYDMLSINCGSVTDIDSIRGADTEGTPVRPTGLFLQQLDRLLVKARASGEAHVTLVGGGAGAFELAMALRHRLVMMLGVNRARVELVYDSDHLLINHNSRVSRLALREAMASGLVLVPDFRVIEAEEGVLYSTDGRQHIHGDLFWAGGPAAPRWLEGCGLALDAKGFIKVDSCLSCIGTEGVFAAGDIIHMTHAPRPKSGVYAVRQGGPLTANIRRYFLGRRLEPFSPQRRSLALVSLGRRRVLVSRGAWGLLGGFPGWRWKDWLDRKFMKGFLPSGRTPSETGIESISLDGDSPESEKMRCGGCGAKLDSKLLYRVLTRHHLLSTDLTGPGEDAVSPDLPRGAVLVQSVDGFRSFLPDPWLMGVIASEHAFNDIYAMGARAHSALIWITVCSASDILMERDLDQTVAGVRKVLSAADARLLGGQSTEGAELSIGLAVNGILESRPWMKSGLRPGDVLLLTKPVGTGVLLAARAMGLCRADWLQAAHDLMTLSNSPAVPIMRDLGVEACTDVTGFGLLGHAHEMALASSVTLVLDVTRIPVLDGAVQCLENGVQSSLQTANERIFSEAACSGCTPAEAQCRVLADPMTSGGLLFGMKEAHTVECTDRLRAAGLPVVRIGSVTARGEKPLILHAGHWPLVG